MSSAEVKPRTQGAIGDDIPAFTLEDTAPAIGGKWEHFPNSHVSHHGAACCDIAHAWLIAFDQAQLNGGDRMTGPRWIRARSDWGPSAWPIHWCEAVGAETIDCGVHAALAHEVFAARGVRTFRAQFQQRYSPEAARSWRGKWGAANVSDHWIDGDTIYHEGNAVLVDDGEVKLWDGSAGWWINPREKGTGYGSLAAVRITADGAGLPPVLRWGERRIKPNRWIAF